MSSDKSGEEKGQIKPVKKRSAYKFSVAEQYQRLLRLEAAVRSRVEPNYPNFLCIGAPRSGTSWLYQHLSKHSAIYIPWFKEVHFLDELPASADVVRLRHHYDLTQEASWRWYSLVYRRGRKLVKGDITPAYMLLSRERIKLVRERMPDVKLIYIMRNPVERAWSGVRRGLWAEHGVKSSEMDNLAQLRDAVFAKPIIDRGDYRRAIENWESEYPGRIHFLFFEDIRNQPAASLQGVADYLGIAPFPNLAEQNPDQKVNSAPFAPPPESIRQELEATYRPQIEYLEQRFNRDLSSWLEFPDPE